MTPGSFDIDTAREFVGDDRMRSIESKARLDADADADQYSPPQPQGKTYWDGVQDEMDRRVYLFAHHKRKDRIQRMAERAA